MKNLLKISHQSILLIVICIGIVFRFSNLNWDNGNRIHPDEALIVNGALYIRFFSNLNPTFHDYNGLSIYMLRAASLVTSILTNNPLFSTNAEHMTIVGRVISAFASTISAFFIYKLALQLFSRAFALVSIILFVCSPLSIQLAHFYTTDSIIFCLLSALFLTIACYTKKTTSKNLLLMALIIGASIATKNTAFFFIPLPLFTILIASKTWLQKIVHTMLFFSVMTITFFFLSPYSFIDLNGYLARSTYLQNVVTGKLLFDWTTQFQQTTPFYWFIQTLYAFGPLAIIGPFGILMILYNWIRARTKIQPIVVISIWTLGFALFLSLTYVKFIRYNAPILVGYIIGFLYLFYSYRRYNYIRLLLYIITGVQILYGVMFSTIYMSSHTSLQAYSWINKNIPNNETIFKEEWNNIIRYEKFPLSQKKFHIDEQNFYRVPDDAKVNQLISSIKTDTYIILDSPKVKNTVQRLSKTYPYGNAFYTLLENGALGFIKVAEFTNYPRIGPFVLNDERAEETFTVFDHPTVRIYKKQRQLALQEIHRIFMQEGDAESNKIR